MRTFMISHKNERVMVTLRDAAQLFRRNINDRAKSRGVSRKEKNELCKRIVIHVIEVSVYQFIK